MEGAAGRIWRGVRAGGAAGVHCRPKVLLMGNGINLLSGNLSWKALIQQFHYQMSTPPSGGEGALSFDSHAHLVNGHKGDKPENTRRGRKQHKKDEEWKEDFFEKEMGVIAPGVGPPIHPTPGLHLQGRGGIGGPIEGFGEELELDNPFSMVYEEIFLNSIRRHDPKQPPLKESKAKERLARLVLDRLHPNEYHRRALETGAHHILTTNYDYNFEKSAGMSTFNVAFFSVLNLAACRKYRRRSLFQFCERAYTQSIPQAACKA